MRKLVITEKANAARRISTILSDGRSSSKNVNGATVISFSSGGDEYNVISLRGHIIELDYPPEYNDWRGVSPVELVYAPQIKTIKVKSIINAINSLVNDSDEVIIATDFDREGELIGMETVRATNTNMSKVKRARFSALTKGEIESAFGSLALPDVQLSDAAEARQIVDLTWGAVLTRLISLSAGQTGSKFLSVGRVQSPTLKILVDRHAEIESFVPVPFWKIIAKFGMLLFKGEHISNPFWEKNDAEQILKKCSSVKTGTVVSYETVRKEEYRPPPFDTTMMQVEANKIGIPPAMAMKLAEDLYTSGFISYPRTENTEYPKSLNLKGVLERLKDSDFSAEAIEVLSQDTIFPSRGKKRTTDHPPIYPTAGARSEKMKGDKWKLYELIVRRFLATLAPNAEADVTKCQIEVAGEIFESTGYVIKELGWKKYYGKYITITDSHLPLLQAGAEVDVRSIDMDESETKPPYRYNQGSLIQEMDRLNLGTKSTRHDIIGKLFSRNYVQGVQMIPTLSGIALTRSLEKHGGGITDPDMTAKLEEDMKKIGSGECELTGVVQQSQSMLHDVAVKISEDSKHIGDEIRSALRSQEHVGTCPECKKDLTIRRSKNGNFIGCNGYPECKVTYPLPRGAMIQPSDEICDVCGLSKLKTIRKGVPPEFVCIDPKCKSNVNANNLGVCPSCGKDIRLMFSKAGRRFAGCSGWPDCKQTYPLRPIGKVVGAGKACETCGSPILLVGKGEQCINRDCPGKKKKKVSNDPDDTV